MPTCVRRVQTRARLTGLGLVLCALAGTAAQAAEPADTDAAAIARERAALQVERDRLEAQFAAELARCSERFAVNACRDEVSQRRRVALEGPRARSLALDDLERSRRAAARREALAQKQRGASAPAVPAENVPLAASAPSAADPAASRAQREIPPHAVAPAASAAAEAAAAQRAAESHRRQASIRAERERVQARQAERARQGKAAAPLPVPAASHAGPR